MWGDESRQYSVAFRSNYPLRLHSDFSLRLFLQERVYLGGNRWHNSGVKLAIAMIPRCRESGQIFIPISSTVQLMQIEEFLNGESLTGTHAAIIFSVWIGLVVIGALILTFVV